MVIEFLTLILGLATGPQIVQLQVEDSRVARVEILLDDTSLGKVEGPPWAFEVDLGDRLAPHTLEAVAFDAQDHEIDRASQLVNVPRPRAEARLSLTGGSPPAAARLSWTAVDFDQPRSVRVSFDGEVLPIRSYSQFALPAHDLEDIHFLRAELDFSKHTRAQAEIAYGGVFADQVDTQLTAVLVRKSGRRELKPEDMYGWFLDRGRPVRVAAVEQGPVELLIVRERSAANRQALELLYERHQRRLNQQARRMTSARPGGGGISSYGGSAADFFDSPQTMRPDDRVRLAFPSSSLRVASQQRWESVPVTDDVSNFGSLFDILTRGFVDAEEARHSSDEQPLAQAVAVAGLSAADSNRRRAVLLVHTGKIKDTSRFLPAEVTQYLHALQVPFQLWTTEPASGGDTAWGTARDVSTIRRLKRALEDLDSDLKAQRVVWLEGSLLASNIELSQQAVGLQMVSENP